MASLAEKRIVEFEPKVEQFEAGTEQQPQTRPEELRLLEALLFASTEPLDQSALAKRMPDGVDIKAALAQLQADYAHRGVNLVRIANKWTFRTAGDLAWLMTRETTETRKLSRAAIEMLAIIAYHQPITRAEIEDIRGVVTSKGTLDVLLETGWIRPRGRRKTPGRPLTFGTTEAFLSQFSLEALGDLPGLEELKGSGLLDTRLPTGFNVPTPSDDPTLREDEDPLESGDLELALAPIADPETDEAAAGGATAEAGQAEGEVETASIGTAEAAEPETAEPETGFAEAVDGDIVDDEVRDAEAGLVETVDEASADAGIGLAATDDAESDEVAGAAEPEEAAFESLDDDLSGGEVAESEQVDEEPAEPDTDEPDSVASDDEDDVRNGDHEPS
ncbi:SMC-Scp complex subunit ScpB [Rhodopseudomonas pseudopalustris]|uniref:Condensin subunit ScpB n=1 Tax=Rhodopseudomonas pseudopalustris TaxID=1513892 RepID=A0A1H8T603_9BRAD|nr:SMC-Scp complex subunit ScpB [Rhodopseudomonas pseudopalustris]SEO86407.1 condensin subunit ScpB [Rhodopseudomonas pseudopalustris]